jgi:hypothetical protein
MIPMPPPQHVKVVNVAVMTSYTDYPQWSGFWSDYKENVLEHPKHRSSFWNKELHFTQLIEATQKAKGYEEGWDGYDAPVPSNAAINYGIELLNKLKMADLSPYSVLPSADGGIGISFRGKGGRRAALEILNDGSSTYVIYGTGHPTLTDAFDVTSPDLTRVFTLISENL